MRSKIKAILYKDAFTVKLKNRRIIAIDYDGYGYELIFKRLINNSDDLTRLKENGFSLYGKNKICVKKIGLTEEALEVLATVYFQYKSSKK